MPNAAAFSAVSAWLKPVQMMMGISGRIWRKARASASPVI